MMEYLWASVLCPSVPCLNSTWHSRPSSNVFSSIRLLILHSSSLCIIPFLDTTLCLIKQESDQIFIARNQATIDNSKKVKWEGKIREIHQNTSAILWNKTLGWVRRSGIERNIRALTNECKCLRGQRLVKGYSRCSVWVIKWINQESKTGRGDSLEG